MTIEQAARDFFGWFNRHYPEPSTNTDHEWNRLGVALTNHQEEAQPAAAGPEVSGQEPMMLVDVCLKDVEELREIAAHFDALGKKSNGDFLRGVANRHEILAGAYRASTVRYERELQEWIERGRTAEDTAAALKWLEEMRGADECRAGEGEQQRDKDLLRQALEALGRARQTAMEQTLKARIPECGGFAGIAQDLDFVVAAIRERLGEQA